MPAAVYVLRPHHDLVSFVSEQPIAVPDAVLDIPGVRYVAPDPGFTRWQCDIPRSTWSLAVVRDWLSGLGYTIEVPLGVEPRAESIRRPLYEHQRKAASFLFEAGGAILGDSMGLGKTTSAIVAAAMAGTPVLIVGPRSVRGVWRREVAEVLGDEVIFHALEGTNPLEPSQRFWLDRASWIFIHYDIVHAWWSQILLRRPRVAIVDEAHLVRNGRTRRGKAAALALSASSYRFLLTGTPILNRVGELWHLLGLAAGPFQWGSPNDFRARYAGAYRTQFGLTDTEPTHLDELQTRMGAYYLRRTVDDVALALPALTRQVIEVEMPDDARETYEDALGLDPRAMMRSILYGTASRKTLSWLSRLRKIVSRVKLETTVAEAQSALDAGESVVVFTWQRTMAEQIASRLELHETCCAVIHGGVTARDPLIAEFQAKGGVLVATIDALSVGVTLHTARIVIMHDLDWVPANMLQAEARVHRIGQQRPVLSKWVAARDTLDQLFVRAAQRKSEAMQSVGDASAVSLVELLGEKEVESSLDALVAWARQ